MDLKEQFYGFEIEMTGLTRKQAAESIATLFNTSATHIGSGYDKYHIKDNNGKTWEILKDSSIHPTRKHRNRQIAADDTYKVELTSPKLTYAEMDKAQNVVRALRKAGGVCNSSCGMHVHIDGANHTPQSIKNALSIMYSKEDILFKELNVNPERVDRWCRKVREPMLKDVRKLKKNIDMNQLRNLWYEGRGGSGEHYNWSRYYALNIHSVFYRGTLEWRCFESTLHAGKVRANITLALAISAQAINQSRTQMKKTEISENPAFTFRTFLLRLGLIGEEYKNVREHLLANLPGDRAWRYDRSNYACLNGGNQNWQSNRNQQEVR